MKSILLIGLGRFGKFIAMKLHTMGHQVMAVDTSEERVNALLPYVTNAQIGDSTNEEFLASLGIGNYDSCIVAIGDNFQNSLETAYLLKELGAKKVIARASREIQEKFLLRNGADEVVYPESSWLHGQQSVVPLRISWSTLNWITNTLFSNWKPHLSGTEKPLYS